MEEEPLISREELTAMLFGIADIREDVHKMRLAITEDDDGEAGEDDA